LKSPPMKEEVGPVNHPLIQQTDGSDVGHQIELAKKLDLRSPHPREKDIEHLGDL